MSPYAYLTYYTDVGKKIAKHFEEMVLLKISLPIFSLINLHSGYLYMFEDMIVF